MKIMKKYNMLSSIVLLMSLILITTITWAGSLNIRKGETIGKTVTIVNKVDCKKKLVIATDTAYKVVAQTKILDEKRNSISLDKVPVPCAAALTFRYTSNGYPVLMSMWVIKGPKAMRQ